jgi:hypothetical protein
MPAVEWDIWVHHDQAKIESSNASLRALLRPETFDGKILKIYLRWTVLRKQLYIAGFHH